ncbi:hypothetical protein BB14905_13710 [Bacillus sp. B14905]|nr:hypothetical protein BB14905_13710 [Bacillus sp. B14905]
MSKRVAKINLTRNDFHFFDSHKNPNIQLYKVNIGGNST